MTASATTDIEDRHKLAQQIAQRTRRNLLADRTLAIASGATLLMVLLILTVILVDVARPPHACWRWARAASLSACRGPGATASRSATRPTGRATAYASSRPPTAMFEVATRHAGTIRLRFAVTSPAALATLVGTRRSCHRAGFDGTVPDA